MRRNTKRINNTIYLMHEITQMYMKKHRMTTQQFIRLDNKVQLLNFIRKCPDVFDGLPDKEMLEEAERYINDRKKVQIKRKTASRNHI